MAYEKQVQDFTAAGTDLPSSKLSTGFVAGERPPANWFNSLFSRITQAIKELQTKSAEKTYVDSTIDQKLEEFGDTVSITLDTALSTTSENAVQNKVVTTAINKKQDKLTIDTALSTSSTNTVQNKVVTAAINNKQDKLTIDTALSTSSTNPVQNKAITTAINAKATKATYTGTIPTSGWTTTEPYYVNVTISGVLATDKPHISPVYTGTLSSDQAIQEAWNKVDRVVANAGSIRVYAFKEVPETAIPIQIEVVR